MTALKVENLCKRYGGTEVLKNVSFSVQKGEIFAVLGVNGAGKTTLLEIVEGLRKADKGTVSIMEKPHAQGLAVCGIQLQSSGLPGQIKASEAVKLYSAWNKSNAGDGLRFGLSEVANKYYKDLSTGWKRRLHLALAVLSDPEIVFLDEPTAGLDVEARAALHDEIRRLKDAGKTIILASHDMAEVESLCDRLIMLSGGSIVFCGSANEFTAVNQGKFKVHIRISGSEAYTVFEIADLNDSLLKLLNEQRAADNTIVDVKIERPTLEDSFLSVARGE